MKVLYLCPRWGLENKSFKKFILRVIKDGYDGVEVSLPEDSGEKEQMLRCLKENNLPFVLQHWETVSSNFDAHKNEYRKRLECLTEARPLFINSQTGKDYFSFEQNNELIALANEISKSSDVKIIHETHRGKFSFAAHIMKPFLEANPDMEIGLDLSHWCNVAESFLDDQKEIVAKTIQHTYHIHARVGYPEGPQVPDPRAPEWQEALHLHLNWWKEVVIAKQLKGENVMTITPEFGPYPYMISMPYTERPISNQWEINKFMKDYLKENLIT